MVPNEVESELFNSKLNWESISQYGEFTLIHKGSYADTYRAKKAGKYFLLKAPHRKDDEYYNILKREYEVSVGLIHPNIAASLTFENSTPIGPCIVMEYIDGMSLADFLTTKLSIELRKKILHQILSAVEYIHLKGIIHNDLKPANILITSLGNDVKIIDFGLSNDDAHYLIKTLGCTPTYASPELIKAESALDVRSDIYSIGKIIAEIFPNRYKAIVKRCTQPSKEKRFGSVAEIEEHINKTKTFSKIALTFAIVFALIVILLLISAPKLLSHYHYRSTLSATEALYRTTCEKEGIPMGTIPYFSYDSFLTTGNTDEQRRDSCVQAVKIALGDKVLKKETDNKYQALYERHTAKIKNATFQIFGLREVSNFISEFDSYRDSCMNKLSLASNRDEFYAHSDKLCTRLTKSLDSLAHTLPNMEGLSTEEINYYSNLYFSGKPFTPYKK